MSSLETILGNILTGSFYRNVSFYWDLDFGEEIHSA